jgi:hypothetical protein
VGEFEDLTGRSATPPNGPSEVAPNGSPDVQRLALALERSKTGQAQVI